MRLQFYEFGLSLCKIVRSSVILLLPLFRLLKVAPSDFDQLGFRFERKYYFQRHAPRFTDVSKSIENDLT
jgi:hypothetical protein